jgi:hypothetical protein
MDNKKYTDLQLIKDSLECIEFNEYDQFYYKGKSITMTLTISMKDNILNINSQVLCPFCHESRILVN